MPCLNFKTNYLQNSLHQLFFWTLLNEKCADIFKFVNDCTIHPMNCFRLPRGGMFWKRPCPLQNSCCWRYLSKEAISSLAKSGISTKILKNLYSRSNCMQVTPFSKNSKIVVRSREFNRVPIFDQTQKRDLTETW